MFGKYLLHFSRLMLIFDLIISRFFFLCCPVSSFLPSGFIFRSVRQTSCYTRELLKLVLLVITVEASLNLTQGPTLVLPGAKIKPLLLSSLHAPCFFFFLYITFIDLRNFYNFFSFSLTYVFLYFYF